MDSGVPLKIGTRGSQLALWQAGAVRDALVGILGPDAPVPELVTIRTSGDQVTDRPLRDIGGKGLFTKELEQALLDGRIDLAVHSVKDMPSKNTPGLRLAACLARASAHDVLITKTGKTLATLPSGAVIGTTSLRRQAQILNARSDLVVRDLRGNIDTRLKKLEAGEFDAIVLAQAGLARLGLSPPGAVQLPEALMLPAVGQGAVGVEIAIKNVALGNLLDRINHRDTYDAVRAERAFSARLGGSCRSPIAGHAWIDGDRLRIRGLVISPDGQEIYRDEHDGPRASAAQHGVVVAEEILAHAPYAFVAAYLRGE